MRQKIDTMLAREDAVRAARHIRDERVGLYDRTIKYIRTKLGGIGYDSVVADYGKRGVQLLRSRFGNDILRKTGRPLDELAQDLDEAVPELQLNGDRDNLWEFLENTLSMKAIRQEYTEALQAADEAESGGRLQDQGRELDDPFGGMDTMGDKQASLNDEDAPFSRGQNQDDEGESLTRDEAQAVVDTVTEHWDNPCEIVVAANETELPVEIYGHIAAKNAFGEIMGVYHRGIAYLVSDNIKNIDQAIRATLHEVAGHHGLRSVLGEMYRPVMALARTNPEILAAAQAKRKAEGLPLDWQPKKCLPIWRAKVLPAHGGTVSSPRSGRHCAGCFRPCSSRTTRSATCWAERENT